MNGRPAKGVGMMAKYIIKRILISIPVFIVITLLVFMMSNLAPGGPLDKLTDGANLSADAFAALKASLGFDKPIIVRYWIWLCAFIQGDFGVSYMNGASVGKQLAERIGPTLLLTLTSLALALLIAIPLGSAAARKRYHTVDYASSGFAFLGQSMPSFLFCLLLIYLLSVKLPILPMNGMHTTGTRTAWDLIKHMIMPVMALSFQLIAPLIRYTRGSMLEVLNEEYVKTARSKGITERQVMFRHVFRNAFIPIITEIGMLVPFLLGGAVVVEQIFSWPGMGSLLMTAISNRDYPVIMGVTCLIAIAVLVTNIMLDIIYALLDPRIRYS